SGSSSTSSIHVASRRIRPSARADVSRFLFVVPPFAGHVNVTVSVGYALRTRGHEVAWALHPSIVGRLLPRDATVYPLDEGLAVERMAEVRASWLPWVASLKLAAELMVGLARDMLPGVEAAIDDFGADVVVADHLALAGPF